MSTIRPPETSSRPTAVPAPPTLDAPGGRGSRVPAVVHLGVGGLRLAHHAVCLHELVRRRLSDDWGLVHVELRPPGEEALLRLDRDDGHGEVEVLTELTTSAADSAAVLDVLADPATRIVTLRVCDEQEFYGLGAVHEPPAAGVAHGYLVRALARRRDAGLPPFTVLSCDPVPRNGSSTREAVLDLARRSDPALAEWIGHEVRFPGSLVDPTLPGPSGLPFRWVVEDDFCHGRPPLEEAGAQPVARTTPYEQLRMHLLDGARCALGLVGRTAGARTTGEALADPRVRAFLGGFLEEAASSLLCVPGVDLPEYRAAVLARLAGSDQPLPRSGSEAVVAVVLPSLRQALDHYRPRRHLVLAVAVWLLTLPGSGSDAGTLLRQHHDLLGTLADDPHLPAELQEALVLLAAGAFDPPTTDAPEEAP
jgi:mannitol 2-dehydrogenase